MTILTWKVARKGGRVNCAEHGINSIVEGDDLTIVSGMPVALEGITPPAVAHWCACNKR
ncbi:PAAR domain-containing protein [Paraburkholderia phymatum]